MALPQQVIDRLTREPPETPGWSFGLLTFSGGILAIALAVYLGLLFGYEPYIDSQIAQSNAQIATLSKAISSNDQASFDTFYSEIANVQTVVQNHIVFSNFLSWLEANTEANVYFSQFSFSSEDRITLTGSGKSEADVNQQIAIFEAAPAVKTASVTSVALASSGGGWQFSISLIMDPSQVFHQSSSTTIITP